jgi:ABC-type oligopeptide transport system ATPase subunit
MQNGQIQEQGTPAQIFENPQSEYTKSLLNAVPIPDPRLQRNRFS